MGKWKGRFQSCTIKWKAIPVAYVHFHSTNNYRTLAESMGYDFMFCSQIHPFRKYLLRIGFHSRCYVQSNKPVNKNVCLHGDPPQGQPLVLLSLGHHAFLPSPASLSGAVRCRCWYKLFCTITIRTCGSY